MQYGPEFLLSLSLVNLAVFPNTWPAVVVFVCIFVACVTKWYLEQYKLPVPLPPTVDPILDTLHTQMTVAAEDIKVLQSAVTKLSVSAGFKPFGPPS